MHKNRRKKKNTIMVRFLIEIIFWVGLFLMAFSCGQVYQKKLDEKYIEEAVNKYNKLNEEYLCYKENSYVLYGKDYYKNNGLLP